ncbi:BolA family transcriptional regulator [Leptospira sp. 2 VSF19]|uniref:BolA family transcriptional regulator n=1 Tax=Leptospira soteropolitanensis TaxID=2950025 RepID=A0AAW5VDN3_9LEPT|nr:BolA family protein [Leptospira soteropolitanensis]MCW7493285.1 BolA family transcriptional regulator [Leptospira soteropolitanensis]MCW7500646.1 BolA family transcriptional regulator [Leptospira soteropolitanensis]MCW7523135.1 BolA family transcriptional regulator [Leptospira soteropolitanensis]MCW7526758.1 BolA family transcriptional regulator [Leptospira soteropolitanensis]MCW7530853.1 BolA family transcriptional regulator [Leptospira soteropolitanensis]
MESEIKDSRLIRMEKILTEKFSPKEIELTDVSLEHAGHPGMTKGSKETHFRLYMVSDVFLGKSTVENHRLVYAELGAEFKKGLHALEMNLSAP